MSTGQVPYSSTQLWTPVKIPFWPSGRLRIIQERAPSAGIAGVQPPPPACLFHKLCYVSSCWAIGVLYIIAWILNLLQVCFLQIILTSYRVLSSDIHLFLPACFDVMSETLPDTSKVMTDSWVFFWVLVFYWVLIFYCFFRSLIHQSYILHTAKR